MAAASRRLRSTQPRLVLLQLPEQCAVIFLRCPRRSHSNPPGGRGEGLIAASEAPTHRTASRGCFQWGAFRTHPENEGVDDEQGFETRYHGFGLHSPRCHNTEIPAAGSGQGRERARGGGRGKRTKGGGSELGSRLRRAAYPRRLPPLLRELWQLLLRARALLGRCRPPRLLPPRRDRPQHSIVQSQWWRGRRGQPAGLARRGTRCQGEAGEGHNSPGLPPPPRLGRAPRPEARGQGRPEGACA